MSDPGNTIGKTKTLVRLSLKAKLIITVLGIPTAGVAAWKALDPYVPALKSEVYMIVDERNTKQTEIIQKSLGQPVAKLIDDVRIIIQDNAAAACARAKDTRDRIGSRIFDLNRAADSAKDDAARTALQKRLIVIKNDEKDADSNLTMAKDRMMKIFGWSC